MPINEILAPSYAKVTYTPTHTAHPHVFRAYFDAVPDVDPVTDEILFPTYTDVDHPAGYRLLDIVQEIADRANTGFPGIGEATVNGAEVWLGETGDNVLLAVDGASYGAVSWGAGNGVAAAYIMAVFHGAHKEAYRLSIFESNNSNPQRFAVPAPPTTDDGSLAWFFCKSPVGFVTQDNIPLVRQNSLNTGYNRKLARSYGRQITP
jgi:hypothetical protein